MTLEDALAPLSLDEFLHTYVGQQYLLLRGTAGRFHPLMSWDDLNGALERVRVNENRVSLVKQSKGVPRESYVETSKSGAAQYLIGPALVKHVSDGATLIVNQIEELIPDIRRLAESCERVFQIYVSANLYAGWRRDNGFDVHWDSHGTLILQLRGRKDWKVWKPTRQHPIGGDRSEITPKPTEDPIWEGTLEDGDVLYMPRGWWHVAFPRDEPSVHITIGLNHPTGLDLLTWLTERMRDSVDVRLDVPFWKDAAAQAEWFGRVRAACIAALDDRAIERFLEHTTGRAHARPFVRLPEQSVGSGAAPVVDDTMHLRLMRGSRLHLQPSERAGMIAFVVNGSTWQCHEGLAPALRQLNHIEPVTLSDLRRTVDARFLPLLRPFLGSLISAGIVWAEGQAASRPAPDAGAAATATASAVSAASAAGAAAVTSPVG